MCYYVLYVYISFRSRYGLQVLTINIITNTKCRPYISPPPHQGAQGLYSEVYGSTGIERALLKT
jgi:hypothetical protein